MILYSNDEDKRSENDDRLEYKDDETSAPEVKNVKISSNTESKSSSKSNRKIDLGAAANFGKDQNSAVSIFLPLYNTCYSMIL